VSSFRRFHGCRFSDFLIRKKQIENLTDLHCLRESSDCWSAAKIRRPFHIALVQRTGQQSGHVQPIR
jgi:hypothetical protein